MCDCESVRVSNKVMEDENDEEVSFNHMPFHNFHSSAKRAHTEI